MARARGFLRGRLALSLVLVALAIGPSFVLGQNRRPLSSPGSDRTTRADQAITLDGRGSSDPDGDTLRYEWLQNQPFPGDQPVALSAPAGAMTTFSPGVPGIYSFTLVVRDPQGALDARLVRITAALPGVTVGLLTTYLGGYLGDGGAASKALLASDGQLALTTTGLLLLSQRNPLDAAHGRIRAVDLAPATISTLAGADLVALGDGGSATLANLASPRGLALDVAGTVFVAAANRIRRIDRATGTIRTVAGSTLPGFAGDGGPAADALLDSPAGVTLEAGGSVLVVDTNNHRIRRIDAVTGTIVTTAGNGTSTAGGDGLAATNAGIPSPRGAAVGPTGDLFVSASPNVVRRIDRVTRVISPFAGSGASGHTGDGAAAILAAIDTPRELAFDTSGNLYINSRLRIRRVDGGGIIQPVAGGGGGSAAAGALATAVAIDAAGMAVASGGTVYFHDAGQLKTWRIDAATNRLALVAGSGAVDPAAFEALEGRDRKTANPRTPRGLALDRSGNLLLTDDSQKVFRVDRSTGLIARFAGGGTQSPGDGFLGTQAVLAAPTRLAADTAGNIYIRETDRVRRVDAASGVISSVAGGSCGVPDAADGDSASKICLAGYTALMALDPTRNVLLLPKLAGPLRRVDLGTGLVATDAGSGAGTGGLATLQYVNVFGIGRGPGRKVVTAGISSQIKEFDPDTGEIRVIGGSGGPYQFDGQPFTSPLGDLQDVVFDEAGNGYAVGNIGGGRVIKLDFATKTMSTIAGTGVAGYSGDTLEGTQAKVGSSSSVALSTDGKVLYFSDDSAGAASARLRKLNLQTRIIDTVTTWSLVSPRIAVAPNGTIFAVHSAGGGVLTSIDPVTGGGRTYAVPDAPSSVAVDAAGFVYTVGSGRIFRINPSTGAASIFAGNGTGGFSGDNGQAILAGMAGAYDMIVTADGALVFIDQIGAKLRRIDLATGIITTIAGYGFNGSSPLSPDEGARAADTKFTFVSRGIAVNGQGDIYLSGDFSGFARVVEKTSGRIRTLTGTSGSGHDLAHDLFGNVYEIRNDTIDRIDAVTRVRTRVAGGGSLTGENVAGTAASLAGLPGSVLAVDRLDGSLFISRPGGHRILVLRSPTIGNRPPVADAGTNRSATFNTTVTLDGSASRDPDNDPVSYQWLQTGGAAATLSDPSVSRPTFLANTTDLLTFRLTVTDGRGGSSFSDVSIQVLFEPDTAPPTAALSIVPSSSVTRSIPVTISAGFNETLRSAPTIVFNRIAGSGSLQGGPMARAGNTNVFTYRFTPLPENTGSFQLQLGALDLSGNVLVAQPPNNILNLNVRLNAIPQTSAGPDRTAVVGTQVLLDGSASIDPDGDPITYSWLAVSGPATVILPAIAKPGFTPSVAGTYVFRLTAADDRGGSGTDTVEVLVTPPLPDLRVTRVQAPLTSFIGGSLELVASVSNEGTASVRDFFNVAFYLSADSSVNVADVFLGSAGATNSLAPSAVIDVAGGPFLVPGALAPGNYFPGAIADSGGAVLEISKENNSRAAAVTTTVAVAPRDDHPGDAASTSAADEVAVDGTDLRGSVEKLGDIDFFRFQATAGRALTLSVQGLDAALLLTLYDRTGTSPIALDNGAARSSTISRIPFTPESSGFHFLRVEFSSGNRTGGYSVKVQPFSGGQSGSDDHPDAPANLGVLDTIEINGLARPGVLEVKTDVDYFRFSATPGNVYTAELTPGTLAAGLLTLFAADGSTQLAEASGRGSGTVTLAELRPAGAGIFFLRAASGDGQASGSYAVSIASRSDVLRAPPAITLASGLAGGQLQAQLSGGGSTIPLGNLNVLVGYDGIALALVNTQRGGAAIGFSEQTNQFLPTFISVNLSAQPPAPLPTGLLEILSFQPAPRARIDSGSVTVVSVAALGSGNTSPVEVFRPTADAGVNQKLVAKATVGGLPRYQDPLDPSGTKLVGFVRLDGRASTDSNTPRRMIRYAWSVVSGPAAFTLSDPAAATPTFVPPAPGLYRLDLVVDNGILRSPSSRVHVSVDEISRIPFAAPRLEAADTGERAGTDDPPLAVEIGRPLVLDGRGSTHPTTARRLPLTYAWTDRLGAGAGPIGPVAVATITPTVPGPQEIELVVTDTAGLASAPARVRFVVRSRSNSPARLAISAGSPSTTTVGTDLGDVPQLADDRGLRVAAPASVTLAAQAVDADVQPGSPSSQRVQFFWRQLAGPAINVSQNGGVVPSTQLRSTLGFTAAAPGLYEFECRLVESDSSGASIGGEVSRRIQAVVELAAKGIPDADIRLSQPLAKSAVSVAGLAPAPFAAGTTLRLDGSNSSERLGAGALSYRWLQVAGPDVVLSAPYSPVTTFVVPDSSTDRLYAFSLYVDDSAGVRGPPAVTTLLGRGQASGPSDPGPLAVEPPALSWTSTPGSSGVVARIASTGTTGPVADLAVVVAYDASVFGLTAVRPGPGAASFTVQRNDFSPGLVSLSFAARATGPVQSGELASLELTRTSLELDVALELDLYSVSARSPGSPVSHRVTRPAAPAHVRIALASTPGLGGAPLYPAPEAGPASTAVRISVPGYRDTNTPPRRLRYRWTPRAAPEGLPLPALNDPDAPSPSFAPGGAGTYSFRLDVDNGRLQAPARTVMIEVDQARGRPFGAVTAAPSGGSQTPRGLFEPPLAVTVGTSVVLDGRGSSAGTSAPLVYTWLDASATRPALLLPSPVVAVTPRQAGPAAYHVVVTDAAGRSSRPSRTRFIARPAGDAIPELSIEASSEATSGSARDLGAVPEFSSEPELRVPAGALVRLQATASDPDVVPGDGSSQKLAFYWRQTEGPAVLFAQSGGRQAGRELSSEVELTLTHAGAHELLCRVVEFSPTGAAIRIWTERSIRVIVEPRSRPAVEAVASIGGGATSVAAGAQFFLDGSRSRGGVGPLSYRWTQLAGPDVVFSSPYAMSPIVEAPLAAGRLAFCLRVTDSQGVESAPDVFTLPVEAGAVGVSAAAELLLLPGMNLINVPLAAAEGQPERSAGDLLRAAEGAFLAYLDPKDAPGHFRVLLPGVRADARTVSAIEGYVLASSRPRRVPLTGRLWARTSLSITLRSGLNMVGYPRGASTPRNASALARATGSAFVLAARPDANGRSYFVAWLDSLTPDWLLEEGGAYLVHVPAGKTIDLGALAP